MPYRHFLLLAGHMDANERRRAKYTAFAFNDPSVLFEADVESSCDVDELLQMCNG